MKDFLKHQTAPLLRAKPSFLLIGAQKAGTTALHQYLVRHPDVVSPAIKELHFFNLYYERGMDWYRAQFPWVFKTAGKVCFEATPEYLSNPEAPARIRNDLGPVKTIAVLREPVQRAWSAWRMWRGFADKPEKAAKAEHRSFAEAIDQELADPKRQSSNRYQYVARGCYAEQISRYRAQLGAETMLILDYAEMKRDLPAFLAKICDFIEISRFPDEVVREMAGERHWVSPRIEPTEADERARERLSAYYAPRNEQLFEMLGRRFEWSG